MNGNNMILVIAMWIGLIVFMWLSGKKRKKKEQEKLDSLKEGQEILTAGGIRGTIVKVNDQYVDVKVAKGVIITFRKTSILGPVSGTTNTENTLENTESK